MTYNLLFLSQICDKYQKVISNTEWCDIRDTYRKVIIHGIRGKNNYYILDIQFNHCWNFTKMESTNLCHQRFGHINYRLLGKIINKELFRGYPNQCQKCGSFQKGKQARILHKSWNIANKAPLDLIGPFWANPTTYY